MIAKADFIEGAAKAFAVLECFDAQRQKINATQAAQRTGLSRAAARRHLLTLAHLGYLEESDGVYWLSSRVLRLSGGYLSSARLPRLVQPALNRLSGTTGCAASVAIRDGEEMVIVARSAAPDSERHLVAHGLHLGARLSLTATSTGRIMLAAMNTQGWEEWKRTATLRRYTLHTLTTWDEFESVIEKTRREDHNWTSEEHELGVQALAVPLRNLAGQTVAALNVVAPVKDHPSSRFIGLALPFMQDMARDLLPSL